MRSLKSLIAAALSIAIAGVAFNAQPAHAWNDFGHMAVAYVAYRNLTPAAKSRVDALLKLNPYYRRWLKQIDAKLDCNTQVFMMAAIWPDSIRSDPKYISDGTEDGFKPSGPEADLNIGYSDRRRHQYWHFLDAPFSDDGTALPKPPAPNAYTQIDKFRKVIASTADDKLKSYDLTWLLHIVGDVHQPLHCATRVEKPFPLGDNGGCDVKVDDGAQKNLSVTPAKAKADEHELNLHWFWDSAAGSGKAPADVIAYAEKLTPADDKLAASVNADDWFAEGFQLAKDKVYQEPVASGNGPFRLSDSYQSAAKEIVNQRIALGGKRLANLLNNELK